MIQWIKLAAAAVQILLGIRKEAHKLVEIEKKVVHVPIQSWRGMAVEKWLDSPERIGYAQELFKQPLFLDMLDVIRNLRVRPDGKDQTQSLIAYGRMLGHQEVLSTLYSLAEVPAVVTDLGEPDYGAPPEEKKSD